MNNIQSKSSLDYISIDHTPSLYLTNNQHASTMPSLTSVPVPIDQVNNVLAKSCERVESFVSATTGSIADAYVGINPFILWTILFAIVATIVACCCQSQRPRRRHNQRAQPSEPPLPVKRQQPVVPTTTRNRPDHGLAAYHTTRPSDEHTPVNAACPNPMQHEATWLPLKRGHYQSRRRMPVASIQASSYNGQDVDQSSDRFNVNAFILESPFMPCPVYQHSFNDRHGDDQYHVDVYTPSPNIINVRIYRSNYQAAHPQHVEYDPTQEPLGPLGTA